MVQKALSASPGTLSVRAKASAYRGRCARNFPHSVQYSDHVISTDSSRLQCNVFCFDFTRRGEKKGGKGCLVAIRDWRGDPVLVLHMHLPCSNFEKMQWRCAVLLHLGRRGRTAGGPIFLARAHLLLLQIMRRPRSARRSRDSAGLGRAQPGPDGARPAARHLAAHKGPRVTRQPSRITHHASRVSYHMLNTGRQATAGPADALMIDGFRTRTL